MGSAQALDDEEGGCRVGRRRHCYGGCEHQADQTQCVWEVPWDDRTCDHLGHPGIRHDPIAENDIQAAADDMLAHMTEVLGLSTHILEAAGAAGILEKHSRRDGKRQAQGQHFEKESSVGYLASNCLAEGRHTMTQRSAPDNWGKAL